MKLTIRQSFDTKPLEPRVRKHFAILEPLRQIDEAIVHVAHEREASPPFHVHAHLVTPGPDVIAEARDHTLAAALRKVVKQLARIIGARMGQRRVRQKSNLQAPMRLANGYGYGHGYG